MSQGIRERAVNVRDAAACALLGAALWGCTGTPAESDSSDAVFDPETLHVVDIMVAGKDLEQLATDEENRVLCTITYDGQTIDGAGIRQKGNTLVALDHKPSFSVKLDESDPDAELRGLHKLLLNGSKQDPTLFHQQLAAGLFTLAGVPAARIAHAIIRLNGEALGLYVVVEAIDKPFLRRHFGEKNDEGNLYEGPCCGDFADDPSRLDLDDEQKDDRTRDDLVALAGAVLDTPDDELAAALDEKLDFPGFLTTHALEALLDHWDGYSYRGNNYYLYDNPADSRFVFLPHGMDRILQDPLFDPETKPLAHLSRRVHAIPALSDRLHAELARVTTLWNSDAILADLDRAASLVHSAGEGGAVADDVADFDDGVAALREALITRRAVMSPDIECGDGKAEGLETCDDGNAKGGDGCSARCRIEP